MMLLNDVRLEVVRCPAQKILRSPVGTTQTASSRYTRATQKESRTSVYQTPIAIYTAEAAAYPAATSSWRLDGIAPQYRRSSGRLLGCGCAGVESRGRPRPRGSATGRGRTADSYGVMLWLARSTFSGSYRCFSSTSRS